jgi:chaperone required for assembly of F1-ATPase
VVHRPQSPATLARLRQLLAARSPLSLAAIEMMTTLAASLITGLSAAEADSDAALLWQAASLEEEWQAQLWGRDEEAEERRARREADFLKAREFLDLARGEDS